MLTITLRHVSAYSRKYGNVVHAILQKAARTLSSKGEVAVSFIGDTKMRELNRTYRGKDKTTNVLSFATTPHPQPLSRRERVAGGRVRDLGDIFISLAVAKKEAKQYGWSMEYAVARLALHGFLHLLGYDHVKEGEAKVMERIEARILGKNSQFT